MFRKASPARLSLSSLGMLQKHSEREAARSLASNRSTVCRTRQPMNFRSQSGKQAVSRRHPEAVADHRHVRFVYASEASERPAYSHGSK